MYPGLSKYVVVDTELNICEQSLKKELRNVLLFNDLFLTKLGNMTST